MFIKVIGLIGWGIISLSCSENLESYHLLENHSTTQILKKKKNNSSLGQISLPVVNRTGIYSHWSGSGDNVYNYSKLLKQNLFISLLLSLFFKKKFFIHNQVKKSNLYTHWEFAPLKPSLNEVGKSANIDLSTEESCLDNNNSTLGKVDTVIQLNQSKVNNNPYYLNLVKLASEKVALELPLYAGKILFLKQRGILISLVFFFQPPKGEWKPKIKVDSYYNRTLTPVGHLVYQSDINHTSPLSYDKHVF